MDSINKLGYKVFVVYKPDKTKGDSKYTVSKETSILGILRDVEYGWMYRVAESLNGYPAIYSFHKTNHVFLSKEDAIKFADGLNAEDDNYKKLNYDVCGQQ